MSSDARYRTLVRALHALPPGKVVSVPREELTPRPASWRRSIGIPYQRALVQWRDGVVHVHETRTHYHLHRDTVDPHAEPLRHLVEDAPAIARRLRGAGLVAAALLAAALLG